MSQYSAEKMRAYMVEYRKKRREEALAYLGGECVVCGVTDGLEIDHIDPETKSFTLSGFLRSKALTMDELDKCQLLCETHHDEKSRAEASVRAMGRERMNGRFA